MISRLSVAAALAVTLVGLTPALAARNGGRGAHVSRNVNINRSVHINRNVHVTRNVHVNRGIVGRRYGPGIWYGTGRRFWRGRWYPYGVGSCWALAPVGYVWICQ